MARMEGVEPPTAWFVARYSIQLSYMRVITDNFLFSLVLKGAVLSTGSHTLSNFITHQLISIKNGGERGIRTLDGL